MTFKIETHTYQRQSRQTRPTFARNSYCNRVRTRRRLFTGETVRRGSECTFIEIFRTRRRLFTGEIVRRGMKQRCIVYVLTISMQNAEILQRFFTY